MSGDIGETQAGGPINDLRDDYARIMHALVLAMRAARCWADIREVADCMINVSVCQFGPRIKEAEHLYSTEPLSGGKRTEGEAWNQRQRPEGER